VNPISDNKIKIAIIEDNLPLRNALEQIFNEQNSLIVVAAMSECSRMIAAFKETKPEIVLMDIGLENEESGIEALKTIGHYFPEIKTLMFTVFEDDDKIFESICAGASGYLLKKTAPDEIIKAIMTLHDGGAPMTPIIAFRTLQLFREKINPPPIEYGLTAREKEILQLLSEGMNYQRIADKLYISISTIRTHICHIYEKLHVHSKVNAIKKMNRY
jgi:DNA-binding NarL/FixJ family response regulator